MIEERIFTLLRGLVDDRVYPRIAPLNAAKPYITYFRAGGRAPTFLGREVTATNHAHMQINVWGTDALVVAQLAQAVSDAMTLATTIVAEPLGAAVDDYEDDTKLYGSRQDFSCWFDR